jgi:hypothetical protein
VRVLRAGVAAAIFLCGCGSQSAPAPPRPETFHDTVHGISVDLPPGWERATTSLTPGLTDPREELSVATFPLSYRKGDCAHMPTSALEDLGPGDAFVTLEERGTDPSSTWPDFPPRPAHFWPQQDSDTEAKACAPRAHFKEYWFGFTDGGRHFHTLVAFGPQASDALRRETWKMLDSLKIDPGVKPDWPSAG